ncbi:hypothetical protein BGC07_08690 [Piscirickettsia litoralis]|uniref:Uncharacterized protein n=1 Tax=Piscirickettsia litoralis TaxID=1891921 RepID=A0ABX3A5Q9_9GAMM|nr:hypothetical protein BGC07_08690 [Piscirickettsia litoralis]
MQNYKGKWVSIYCDDQFAFKSGALDARNNQEKFYSYQESGNIKWCGLQANQIRESYLQGYHSSVGKKRGLKKKKQSQVTKIILLL